MSLGTSLRQGPDILTPNQEADTDLPSPINLQHPDPVSMPLYSFD